MTDSNAPLEQTPAPAPREPARPRRRNALIGVSLVAAIALGALGGAGASRLAHRYMPQQVMLLQPAAIGQMKPDTMVAAKGKVAELFGNKFILDDGSGRVLVDTGPQGDNAPVADKDETVTVQGHFDRGQIHAQLLVRANGDTLAFGPPPPPHGPKGPKGPKEARRGPPPPPDAGPDAPPPVPPR
ncbi:MAG: hypothetical protein JSR72_05415 [Proteobacteria bacterium]|nr:hypothetical protein [Pseudomonadota bacterium]